MTLIGSKRKSHGRIRSGLAVLAAQNALRTQVLSISLLSHPWLDSVWGRRENASFLFLGLPQQTSSRVSQAILRVYAHCWTSHWRGNEIMQNSQPLSRRCMGCLGEWQASEQNWGSFGKREGGKCCIFHLWFPCLEAIDNGVDKTFSPKFCTDRSDGYKLVQDSKDGCRLETQAVPVLWIKSNLCSQARRGAPVLVQPQLLRKRERGGGDAGSSFSCFNPFPCP